MTTTTLSAAPGFNVEKMEQFCAFAESNPNDVVLGIEAKTIWEGTTGHSLAKIGPWALAGQKIEKPTRDYSIQFGAWKEVEDAIGVDAAQDKVEPVEAALAAVSACVTWAICINSALEGVSFETLEVRTRANVDPRVLLGVLPTDEAASCLQTVEMDIDVTGATASDRAKIAEMAKRSPVHALITHANSIVTNVNVA